MPDSNRDSDPPEESSGLSALAGNIAHLPRHIWASIARHPVPDSARSRAEVIVSNFFLHIQSARIHRWSLKKSFTLGLGVASAVLFLILLVTGVMLMVYYKPTTGEAYNSVKDIHYVVTGGRLLRNVHRWATNLMILTVVIHMCRVFFTASYKAPREFNWVLGVGLLVLTLGLSFTGYCLPWDQLSYWAVVIGTNIAGSFSEITQALGLDSLAGIAMLPKRILLGSDSIGTDALLRFYWIHCIALPLMMVLLMALHFWRIRKDGGLSRPNDIGEDELHGLPWDRVARKAFVDQGKSYSLMAVVGGKSPQVDKDTHDTVSSWPHALRAEMVVAATTLAVVLLLATFFDAPLREPADPLVPENPAKAPWYFLGLQEIVSYSAFAGGVAVPVMSVLGLALIPYLDRENRNSGRWPGREERRWTFSAAAFSLALIVGILAVQVRWGWLRDWFPNINQLWIVFVNPGTLVFGMLILFSVCVTRITNSTRQGAVSFFSGILVFYIVFTYFGIVHRGPNWDFYWWPTLWPVH